MTLSDFAKRAEKLIVDNSPSILTAIGVTGTVTTAYLTGKASFKAGEVLNAHPLVGTKEASSDGHIYVYKKDVVKVVWKLYLPAAASGVLTIACIVFANRIGARRAAAVAAAYSLSEKAFSEYKDKVVEKVTPKKEKEIRDDLAQDRVNRNPLSKNQVIITGNGDVMCYDQPTGRYFKSNVESLRRAENDINQQVIGNMYAPLSDFYNLLKLTSTPYSEEVGWTTEKLLEIEFSTTLSDDNQPCICINYNVIPIREYK